MSDPQPMAGSRPWPPLRMPSLDRVRRRRRARTQGQRVALAIAAGLTAAVIVLLLDGIWAGRAMFRSIASSRSALAEGAVAVVTGDPAASRPFFVEAGGDAEATLGAASHPSVQLASRLPWIGDNIRAVEAVAKASEQTADAGLAMADAATALGWQDLRVPATPQGLGALDLPALRAAMPKLDEAAKGLAIAAAQLEAVDPSRLVGPIAAGFEDALDTLRRRAAIATDTRDVARLLPGFLGGGGARRYLLAVQTLGVPQGTGGRIDLVTTMTAERGVLTLDAPLRPAGEIYADANETPDGPTTSQTLLVAAQVDGLGPLDGVILIDSVWLQDAVWIAGSVPVPGQPPLLTMDNTADTLERSVYEVTDEDAAETSRAHKSTAILESYLASRPSAGSFAIGMAAAAGDRHLILYSTRPREQEILERLGAAGVFDPIFNPLAVTWRSLVDNHAVLFARRTITHTVTLTSDGVARMRTLIELANQSPEGPPSVLLGTPLPATVPDPGDVEPVGGWAGEVQVALPRNATRITAETSIPSATEVVREQGRESAVATLATDPGDTRTLIVAYTVQHATPKGVRSYRMLVFPQPTLDPGIIRVRIDVPTGSAVQEASEQMQVEGASATFTGSPRGPVLLFVRW